MKDDKKFEIKAPFTLLLSEQDIEDLMVTALNGGIGYWACLDNCLPEYDSMGADDCVDAWTAKILVDGGDVVFLDEDERETEYVLTLEKLLNGIRQFIEKGYDEYGAIGTDGIDWCNLDADAADKIVQLALFDDIVFG